MSSAAFSAVPSASGLRDRVLKLPWWSSLKNVTYELCMKYSIHGYKNLVEAKRMSLEKFIWFVVHVVAASVSLWIVWSTWTEFTDNPTITTLESQNYPIGKKAFPAVALCNINRISKSRARQYAIQLAQKSVEQQRLEGNLDAEVTEELIARYFANIRYLGRLLDFDIEGNEIFLSFQEELEVLDPDPLLGMWDVQKTFEYLRPNCEDLLLSCRFQEVDHNCTELFKARRTGIGVCCVFNSARPSGDKTDLALDAAFPVGIGWKNGLNIVVNTSTADYYYPIMNFPGIFVLLADPMEYADITTGNARTEIIDPNTENFIRISVNVYESDSEVKNYAVEKRNCKFSDEDFEEYRGRYTYTECLIKCKIKSIIDLCGCIPFFMPINHVDLVKNTTLRCTLQHIPCLNKYRVKWRTITPSVPDIPGLEQEYQDSLNCPQCFSLCGYTQYKLEGTFNPIIKNPPGGMLQNYTNITDMSIIRVFYAEDTGLQYKISVTNTWFDLLSTFGGLFGLFLGFSIMTVLEIVYFCCFRMYQYLTRQFDDEEDDLKISIRKEMYPSRKLPPSYKEIERSLVSGYNRKMKLHEVYEEE
ncbi:sodium channel protein Nach-like [Culicoides brevitarsis]|uniref:sodium channel protein Nach-like n=1 Tax=Culicoides brevitarsis TaxID=469753 RepID=UPI00307BBF45